MENGAMHAVHISTPLHGYGIRDILIDKDNTLWLASYSGLLKKMEIQNVFLQFRMDCRRLTCAEY